MGCRSWDRISHASHCATARDYVSKTHKESGKDKGDGVIYGGWQQYYKITDETENDKAAGLFVKKQDVRPV